MEHSDCTDNPYKSYYFFHIGSQAEPLEFDITTFNPSSIPHRRLAIKLLDKGGMESVQLTDYSEELGQVTLDIYRNSKGRISITKTSVSLADLLKQHQLTPINPITFDPTKFEDYLNAAKYLESLGSDVHELSLCEPDSGGVTTVHIKRDPTGRILVDQIFTPPPR